jgi:hypothetical protein
MISTIALARWTTEDVFTSMYRKQSVNTESINLSSDLSKEEKGNKRPLRAQGG